MAGVSKGLSPVLGIGLVSRVRLEFRLVLGVLIGEQGSLWDEKRELVQVEYRLVPTGFSGSTSEPAILSLRNFTAQFF
jgi:hypothetical protein